MTDAYVMIAAQPGAVSEAATEIRNLDAVGDVHVITGDHDVVAQLELADLDDLPGVVADQIHSISGVVDTVTHVAFEP